MTTARKIPCTIVTGFLGAGKSSLIGHLVPQQRSDAVAIISFASEPVIQDFDGRVSAATNEQFAAIPSFDGLANADVVAAALKKILARPLLPERIVFEIGGLDLPSSALELVAHPDFAETIVADSIIAVVDGYAVSCPEFGGKRDAFGHRHPSRRQLATNHIADIFVAQLLNADIVLLNKIDLITSRDRADIINRVRDIVTEHIDIIETCGGNLPEGYSFASLAENAAHSKRTCTPHAESLSHASRPRFFGATFELPVIASERELLQRLANVTEEYDVLRMKGLAYVGSQLRRFDIEGVGRRVRLDPLLGSAAIPQLTGFLTIVSERHLAVKSIREIFVKDGSDVETESRDASHPLVNAPTGKHVQADSVLLAEKFS